MPFLHLGYKGLGLQYVSRGNDHKGYAGDRDFCPLILFLDVLKYADVLGDARCVNIIGEHLRGEVDNV